MNGYDPGMTTSGAKLRELFPPHETDDDAVEVWSRVNQRLRAAR